MLFAKVKQLLHPPGSLLWSLIESLQGGGSSVLFFILLLLLRSKMSFYPLRDSGVQIYACRLLVVSPATFPSACRHCFREHWWILPWFPSLSPPLLSPCALEYIWVLAQPTVDEQLHTRFRGQKFCNMLVQQVDFIKPFFFLCKFF